MTYIDAWKPIASRIHALKEAANLYARFLTVKDSDSFAIYKRMHAQCVDIVDSIKEFQQQFEPTLPTGAIRAISQLIAYADPLDGKNVGIKGAIEDMGRSLMVALAAFEGEMSYHLFNLGEALRSRCDVAFEHLPRLIVVDEDVRRRWQSAFVKGEIECERLGSVHLLLHEIWAFKVSGTGERTDLIFPAPPNPIGALTGLVLTEWKVSKATGRNYFEEAFKQARLYSQGVLAGTELATYRYLVVVSETGIETPTDRLDTGVVYRHINIPVEPETPSKAARRKTSSSN